MIAEHLIVPKFIYIESALNPWDPISRGEPGPLFSQGLTRSFELSDELTELLDAYV
jgi:hypothetical protein